MTPSKQRLKIALNKFSPNTSSNQASLQEQIFSNGSDYFAALEKDIDHAQQSIDIETYIFNNDALGKRIVSALCNAAARGVNIRVLVDGAGSPFWHRTAKRLEKSGIRTKIFHPYPWELWNWGRSVDRFPTLIKGLYLLLKVNSRNHRKVIRIDNKIVFVGSINISQCHLGLHEGGRNWRDTAIRIMNANFIELQKAFEIAWSHRTIKERIRDAFKHIRREPHVRLNYTRHRRRILHKNLLRRIRLCQKRIWITNAYFVPDNFLLKRLKEAAHNGVDVRILLPNKSDVRMMPWASSTFYHSLLEAGVKIYEYLPSMLHAKSLILDDWVLIGSSNLNHRSLLHDLEVDTTVFTAAGKKTIEQFFLKDIAQSRELKLDNWKSSRPFIQRFLGRLVLYLKYWI